MHILYFGCLATDLLVFFYKDTTLRCYGNYASKLYPTKSIVRCSWLLLGIDEQNHVHLNVHRLFDFNFQSQEVREKYQLLFNKLIF